MNIQSGILPLFCIIPILFGVVLTTKQVADILGIGKNQVARLCDQGKIKSSKIGRDWLIEENDLKNFQNNRPPHGGSRPGAGRPKQKPE
jgi:excisionase family DNA binding protein